MKKYLIPLTLASFLWMPVQAAWSGDFIAARSAYIDRDYEEAAKLFHELALEGDHRGMSFLGRMYDKGLGVPKNPTESVRWHQAAAKKGNGFSANQVALAHLRGVGVRQDPVQAEMWFTIAIQRGFGWANRKSLEKKLTREQAMRGRKMAADFMKKNNMEYKTK
ncbi:MAG: sel1 repeat family protein [Alphaproteobacteria bacterium]|jgi:TPR repeat protein|nr:sel1 repeat family protein [Alphaproteobacteria bacterium]MBT4084135.1 sel1 repeat family protein [Alphaproteobacteria bacterium]MBT4546504.1 sel1 repeat family protein [Alphaproteobacteria bacterium]MBT7745045.1 sel1 repeat family protein [Alphaproteobacteria bacterium]